MALVLGPFPGTPGKCETGKLTFGEKVRTVVLDPGHGGYDAGARGPDGTLEKNVCLAVARRVADRCEDRFRVVLTRTDDYRMETEDRPAVANRLKADLFISIHTGGGFLHQTKGFHVYYHAGGQPTAPKTGTGISENETESGTSPTPWDLLQKRHAVASRDLAGRLLSRLVRTMQLAVDTAQGLPLVVLQGADMPAALIEIGYITNPSTEARFGDNRFITAVSDAICAGIDEFLNHSN